MTDERAKPLYDVSATWLLKERIEELKRQLAEARNAALEEAAKMADEWGDLSLAEAIRALKTEPKP
jgi:uncharacterized protein YbjQ (UPF0145 family)